MSQQETSLLIALAAVLATAILASAGWLIRHWVNGIGSEIHDGLDKLSVQLEGVARVQQTHATTLAVLTERISVTDKHDTAINSLDRNLAVVTAELDQHQQWHERRRPRLIGAR